MLALPPPGAPYDPAFGAPFGGGFVPVAAAAAPVLIDDASTFRPADLDVYPQIDYRFYRYSKFATAWLIFMVLWFITLLCLTLWQGPISIRAMRNGVPRDLETGAKAHLGDGGLPRENRNLRIATAICGIVPPLIVLAIYYIGLTSKLMRTILYILILPLVACLVMGIIAFAIDVGKTSNVEACQTQLGTSPRTQYCENREALGIAAVALDMTTAFLALLCIILIALWAKWFRNEAAEAERALLNPGVAELNDAGLAVQIPGQSLVYKTLIALALLCLLISASLLLLFTILIHELRERVEGPQWGATQEYSGWSQRDQRLRLSTTIVAVMLVILSLIPYPHRVYAYILAIAFFFTGVMFFVIFGLDVGELKKIRNQSCPAGLSCIYHPYNTVVVLDFICGVLIAVYLIVEFAICMGRSYVVAREYAPYDIIDDYDFGSDAFLGGPSAAVAQRKLQPAVVAKASGGLRPLLGVEVVEIEQPHTGELTVNVLSVTPGGACDEAGVRVGDIIARWNDMPIHSKADFAAAVRDSLIGSVVSLQVIRQNALGYGNTVDFLRLVVRGVAA